MVATSTHRDDRSVRARNGKRGDRFEVFVVARDDGRTEADAGSGDEGVGPADRVGEAEGMDELVAVVEIRRGGIDDFEGAENPMGGGTLALVTHAEQDFGTNDGVDADGRCGGDAGHERDGFGAIAQEVDYDIGIEDQGLVPFRLRALLARKRRAKDAESGMSLRWAQAPAPARIAAT